MKGTPGIGKISNIKLYIIILALKHITLYDYSFHLDKKQFAFHFF